jgi:outer membrane biosynthesis protein TonB
VLISEKGEILDAEPGPDTGVDPGFVKAALRAVRRWSYSPAFKNGVAVRVWKTLIIDFRIR